MLFGYQPILFSHKVFSIVMLVFPLDFDCFEDQGGSLEIECFSPSSVAHRRRLPRRNKPRLFGMQIWMFVYMHIFSSPNNLKTLVTCGGHRSTFVNLAFQTTE